MKTIKTKIISKRISKVVYKHDVLKKKYNELEQKKVKTQK